jgi:hypothetical protein
MSGGMLSQPSPGAPSPTSPLPYQHQPLAARSYQRDGPTANRYDGVDDRTNPDRDPPTSAKSMTAKLNPTNSMLQH